MPLEGKINSFSISYETVLSDLHPAVTQSLIMDDTVTAKVPAGTILKKVAAETVKNEDGTEQQTSEDTGTTYAACTESDTPATVLLEDYDPAKGKEYAMCILHGTVKADLLLIAGKKPTPAMLEKLQGIGIFAV